VKPKTASKAKAKSRSGVKSTEVATEPAGCEVEEGAGIPDPEDQEPIVKKKPSMKAKASPKAKAKVKSAAKAKVLKKPAGVGKAVKEPEEHTGQ